MVRNEPITAVIPVRGGSKGVPRKNLYRLGGTTLLERSILYAKASPRVDRVVVSTEDAEMYAVARRHGVEAPTMRPYELATDEASTIDVVRHLVETVPISRGYILLLQVTSPLRILDDVEQLCGILESGDATAQGVVSLVRHEAPHPDKIQSISDGFVRSYLGRESMVSRQLLPEVYALNGALYLTHRDVVINQGTLMPKGMLPYLMPAERSLNLDGPLDFFLLESLLEKGRIELEEYQL